MEGKEKTGAGAFVGLHRENRPPVKQHVAPGDRVVGVPRDGLGQRGLAGAIGPHERMHLPLLDDKGKARDNGLFPDVNLKVADFELAHGKNWSWS